MSGHTRKKTTVATPATCVAYIEDVLAKGWVSHIVDLSHREIHTLAAPDDDAPSSYPALADVEALTVAGNYLTLIEAPALAPFTSLTLLDLSANNLITIPALPPLPALATLDLSLNPLGDALAHDADACGDALASLPALQRVSLRQCKIESIDVDAFVAPLASLTWLSLTCNSINAFPTLSDTILSRLTWLSLAHNPCMSSPSTPPLLAALASTHPHLELHGALSTQR